MFASVHRLLSVSLLTSMNPMRPEKGICKTPLFIDDSFNREDKQRT